MYIYILYIILFQIICNVYQTFDCGVNDGYSLQQVGHADSLVANVLMPAKRAQVLPVRQSHLTPFGVTSLPFQITSQKQANKNDGRCKDVCSFRMPRNWRKIAGRRLKESKRRMLGPKIGVVISGCQYGV